MRFAIAVVPLLAGCTSGPDYAGVYEVTAHTWIAEIEVGAGQLRCAQDGRPTDDGAGYFGLVTDSGHGDEVQWVRCEDAAGCAEAQPDTAWFTVDGPHGVNARATVIHGEFSPPYCRLDLETFEVADASTGFHIDRFGRRGFTDDLAKCTVAQARALAAEPTCIRVERIDGRLVP